MKTKNVIFWISETKQYLVFTFEKEYDEGKVMEDINGYYREYLNPDEAGVEEEMLDEIESSSITSWIVDHMYDCGDYDIEDVAEINVSDYDADTIDALREGVATFRKLSEDSADCSGYAADADIPINLVQKLLCDVERKVLEIASNKLRRATERDFMSLTNDDSVYLDVCGCLYQSKVIGEPFWNSDADEPGWEIETDNGYADMYSIYVSADEPIEKRDWSLDRILNYYFRGGELDREESYHLLVSLVYDLESLGVLPDANDVIAKLDELDSERE